MVKLFKFLFLIIATLPLLSCGEPELILEGRYAKYGTTDILAGMSFPPFSNSRAIDFTVKEIGQLSIDRIRIAIDWRNREPSRGKFYWDPMDQRMKAAKDNGISVFLTIASVGPDWALLTPGSDGANIFDEDALQTFIKEILKRYDSIDKIQFGNEWETGTDESAYSTPESIEKFITYTNILYDAVQNHSPDTQVVLGGLTRTYPIVEYFSKHVNYPDFSGIDLVKGTTVEDLKTRIDKIHTDYVSKGIKENIERVFNEARYDMLDIHLYDDPENWSEYLSILPNDRPILVSEFGGPNSEFENTAANYQAVRMDDYIDAIESLPIVEAYYFKLVESNASYHKNSGLFFSSLIMKPARNSFAKRLTTSW